MTVVDQQLVVTIAQAVSEALADECIRRTTSARLRLDLAGELEFSRGIVDRHLDALASQHLAAGVETLSLAHESELVEAVIARVLGLGRIQPLLDSPEINDIHIRGAASTWLKLTDGRRVQSAPVVDTDDELIDLVRLVAARVGRSERRFDAANPELNIQLPDGSRLFATMEVSSRPSVIIRKHRFELSALAELQDNGLIDEALSEFLGAAVRAKRNIVIAGGTGSGKTTMLRALLNEVPSDERIVTIEDAYELGLDRFEHLHPDYDMLQSRPANIEGRGAISMVDLTRMALRMDPDRVVVGEVRGPEAFPMLMAMSQGNNGSMCTMHADSTRTVFPKLAAYVSMAQMGLPVDTVNLLLATALHFVIHIETIAGVRRVASVRQVVDADGSRIVSNEVFKPGLDGRAVPGYPLRDNTLSLLEEHGFDAGYLDKPDGWWNW